MEFFINKNSTLPVLKLELIKYIDDLDKVGKGENDYHVDYIVSIKECFINNIDPVIASDSTNLRAIPRKENLSKGPNSLFTAEILLANVTERNNNKIKMSELWNFLSIKEQH